MDKLRNSVFYPWILFIEALIVIQSFFLVLIALTMMIIYLDDLRIEANGDEFSATIAYFILSIIGFYWAFKVMILGFKKFDIALKAFKKKEINN